MRAEECVLENGTAKRDSGEKEFLPWPKEEAEA